MAQGVASVAGAIAAVATSNPLNFFLYSSKINLGATIQDLQTKNVLQIQAEHTITTISGQKADFLSGGEFPFPIVQPGGTGSSPVVTISFRPYGIKVEFTPQVNEDGNNQAEGRSGSECTRLLQRRHDQRLYSSSSFHPESRH